MAPTVCLAEFPTAGSTVNEYIRRRNQRSQNNANNKRRTSTERTLRARTVSETSATSRDNFPRRKSECTNTSEYSLLDKSRKISTNVDESCRRFILARRDLLNIVIRTIILVRRNRILQRRVNELRAETRKFLCSVLNNPENQCRQRCLKTSQPEGEIVSTFTDRAVTTLSPPLSPDPTGNSYHVVSTARDIRDCDNGAYSPNKSDSSQAEADVDF